MAVADGYNPAMPSPFPGMDPYLERHWLDVHTTLITLAKSALNRSLPPDLIARSEERLAIDAADWVDPHGIRPDVRVFQPGTTDGLAGGLVLEAPYKLVVDLDPVVDRFVKIVGPDEERLVAVIELLSPWNKQGRGLAEYRRKRVELVDAGVHVVEIDLVRRGDWRELLRPHACPADAVAAYRVVTRLGGQQGAAFLYPLPIDQPLRPIPIPLRPGDPPLALELQRLVDEAYADSRYGQTIDYTEDPDPRLHGPDAARADELLRSAGRR